MSLRSSWVPVLVVPQVRCLRQRKEILHILNYIVQGISLERTYFCGSQCDLRAAWWADKLWAALSSPHMQSPEMFYCAVECHCCSDSGAETEFLCIWELFLKFKVVPRCDCSDGSDPAVRRQRKCCFLHGDSNFPQLWSITSLQDVWKGEIKHICKYFQ